MKLLDMVTGYAAWCDRTFASVPFKIVAMVAPVLLPIAALSVLFAPPPEEVAIAPTPTPAASVEASPMPSVTPSPAQNWKSLLPAENPALRQKYEADPLIQGWLAGQNVWIGNAVQDDLLKNGFFINVGWDHDGNGLKPEVTAAASCSMLGSDAYICGRGFNTWQWGVQSQKVADRFIELNRN